VTTVPDEKALEALADEWKSPRCESWCRFDRPDYAVMIDLLKKEIDRLDRGIGPDGGRMATCKEILTTLEHAIAGREFRGRTL